MRSVKVEHLSNGMIVSRGRVDFSYGPLEQKDGLYRVPCVVSDSPVEVVFAVYLPGELVLVKN